jgi:hypothetical protein
MPNSLQMQINTLSFLYLMVIITRAALSITTAFFENGIESME